MRRADRTGSEDHLASRIGPPDGVPWPVVAREFDANRARPVDDHAVHQRIGDDLEVRPLGCRPQIGARGAGPTAPTAGLLAPADAVAGARRQIVDVGAIFEPELLGSLD